MSWMILPCVQTGFIPLSPSSSTYTSSLWQETEGYKVFEDRRRQKYSKAIAGGVLMGSKGMDEGVDRK